MRKIYSVLGIALALMGGVALAASQSASAPPSGSYTMTATVTHDASGGDITLCGGKRGFEEIEWSIDFGGDLLMNCNGESAGAYVPGVSYTVTVDVAQNGLGDWVADTTVVDDSTGQIVFTQTGHVMGQRPDTAHANADVITTLTCD